MGHMVYQADYLEARNRYARHFRLEDARVPAFYQQLASQPAGTVKLAVAPWYLEWHWNSWHLYQQRHLQRIVAGFVTGLCTDKSYGEFPPGVPGLEFSNIVHLSELASENTAGIDYLVFEKSTAFRPPPRVRPDLDLAQCEQRIRGRFGEPLIDDGILLVYSLR
jgi:hypothetical protein